MDNVCTTRNEIEAKNAHLTEGRPLNELKLMERTKFDDFKNAEGGLGYKARALYAG